MCEGTVSGSLSRRRAHRRARVLAAALASVYLSGAPAFAQPAVSDYDLIALGMVAAVGTLPAEIGLLTQAIGTADTAATAPIPPITETRTSNADETKDGVRQIGQSTHQMTYTLGPGRLTAEVRISSTTTSTQVASGAETERTLSTARGYFEIGACPNAEGVAEGRVSIAAQHETTRPGGRRAGGAVAFDGPIRFVNGEDAHLTRVETTVQIDAGNHGVFSADGGPPEPFDAGLSISLPMAWQWQPGSTVEFDLSQGSEREEGDPKRHRTADLQRLPWLMFLNLVEQIGAETEKFWRSGKCIELKPSEQSRDVSLGEQISLTVEAVHKLDGAQVVAPI